MAEVITSNFPAVPTWLIGLFIVVAVSLVIFGGIRWIAKICEKLIPFMALAYALGCIIIIAMNWAFLADTIVLICTSAFSGEAAFGGAVGFGLMQAMRAGCARGLFSNESGMGSAPIAASAAKTRNPARQSLVSMTGTFWDTVVICALTGIVIVSTMLAYPEMLSSGEITAGGALTSAAFSKIPFIGTPILVVGMILFAFTTTLGWSYYGDRCITYLFGKRAIKPYHVLYVIVAFLGAIGIGDLVWQLSDIANALMVIPNIIVVLLLSGLVARETKHYVYQDNLLEVDETPIPTIETK